MHSTCPGAPPLPSSYTLSVKDPALFSPLEAFMVTFEPNSIDGKQHAKFRPALHAALEYYAANRAKMFASVPAQEMSEKMRDEHKSGLDG